MYHVRSTLICLLGLMASTVIAQIPGTEKALSNLRYKTIPVSPSPVYIDTLSIVPGTLRMAGVPDSLYHLDWLNAALQWKQLPVFDSVRVEYRVFPVRWNAVSRRMDYDSVMNNFLGKPFIPDFGRQRADDRFFDMGNIQYTGSLARGLAFGNSQDAVVTSNLNVQMNGYLADSIEITAAITDNNIPIQPDGTTQQLNEFDRIFLQFKKKAWQLSLGDIDIRRQESFFLRFYKRLQGVSLETNNQIGSKGSSRTTISASVAKGKFTRNIFQGQEGNQGPYRLQGANNEFFFIVLANTERVFIDGELLLRGEDQDYVINYNTAEITFTPKRMITKDRRIQVEFEYADRNYLNANLYFSNQTTVNEKLKVHAGVFHNSDVRNSPINQSLDPAQKDFLRNVGGDVRNAFYPNAVLDSFEYDKILYRKVDTLFNGGLSRDSVYVYSTDPLYARYRLSFIEVGQGNGNYLPDFNGANGKVFKWVEPVNGVKQGRFEPAIFLVTPKRQQVMNTGLEWKIGKKTVIAAEGAMSLYDVNLFSAKENGQNRGYAAKGSLKHTETFSYRSDQLQWNTEAGFEWVQAGFKPLERLRNVEFSRDWGLALQMAPADERILTASTGLVSQQNNALRYQWTHYQRSDGFTGWRNSLKHEQRHRSWNFNNLVEISRMRTNTDKGNFFRPTLQLVKNWSRLKNLSLAVMYTREQNELRSLATDSMSLQSFSFSIFQASLRSDEKKLNQWSLTYFTRADAYPVGKELLPTDRSQNVQFNTSLLKNETHQFRMGATYRKLNVFREGVAGLKDDNGLLGRAEYLVNAWNGLVSGNILYETGAGQEQKRDITFVEVPAGQGGFAWFDYNGDGIQQLNEFEAALFRDQAKYIRIFTPSNEFIKANYSTFNYNVSLNPRAARKTDMSSGRPALLSRINLQSSLQVSRKEMSDGRMALFPIAGSLNDTSLLTMNALFVNTFSFNRFSTVWGLDINNTRNSQKALLTYGYESRMLRDWNVRFRWNIDRAYMFEAIGRWGSNELSTSNAAFDNRNYLIRQLSAEPKVTYTKGANFRIAFGYRLTDKENTKSEQERVSSHAFNAEMKYNLLQSTSLQAKLTYTDIRYRSLKPLEGVGSPAAYMLLEGLLPGKNLLWNLDFTRRLSSSLELNMQYEGRKPGGGARVVHIGRASVRALL